MEYKECLCCGDACQDAYCAVCEKRSDRDEIAEANAIQRAYEEWCEQDRYEEA